MKNSIVLFLLSFFSLQAAFAQSEVQATTQPNIMIIPYAAANQSLRLAYDRSDDVRVAVVKVKEAFDNRGVNTIDFRARMKQANNTDILQGEQEQDLKDKVIAMSGADIYVEVETKVVRTETGNSASVILSAYDAFSGESLSNRVANSPKIYTENYERLIEKAIESDIDNFLNTIQEKFTDMIINGRTIVLNIGIEEGQDFKLDDEDPESYELFSDMIEQWVEENALNSTYRLQGTSSNRMIFDIVKIPLKDENNRNYKVSGFASSFRKYLRSKNIDSKQVIQGNNIVITLSKT